MRATTSCSSVPLSIIFRSFKSLLKELKLGARLSFLASSGLILSLVVSLSRSFLSLLSCLSPSILVAKLPAWMPGVSWKRVGKHWQGLMGRMIVEPYMIAKKEDVRLIFLGPAK